MGRLVRWLDRWWYPAHADHWDDKLLRQRILGIVTREHVILDLGAGAGIVREMNFKGLVARVSGIDPDPRVKVNPHLDEGRVGVGDALPWPDKTFDVVFCDNVLEHLPDPQAVFLEVYRVLKPGGTFIAKTPNAWHYMPLIARLTPTSFHRFVNRLRGRDSVDTFPTLYRANTAGAVRRLAKASGLREVSIERIEGRPEYLRMTAATYVFGWAYERVVNSGAWLERFRILLLVTLAKPAA